MKNFLIQESAMSIMPQISKRNENTVEFIAVLQEANRPNRNGRIYRKEVLEQALAAPYVQERLRTNSFYSECGHPMDTSVQRQMTVDQRNIACLIKEFWWEGDLLKARVETANTAIGRDMKGLIEQGSRVAFSLRAQGNVHHDPMLNATIVEAPIQIATYDWVVNPSHDKAFLESICEATTCGLFGSKQTNSLVLAESINLFENGNLISLSEVAQPVVVDYAKNFGLKVKSLSEAYIYQDGDVLTESGKVATVVNDNVTKKVVLEDFLLKDLRHRIARLTEESVTESQEADQKLAGPKWHGAQNVFWFIMFGLVGVIVSNLVRIPKYRKLVDGMERLKSQDQEFAEAYRKIESQLVKKKYLTKEEKVMLKADIELARTRLRSFLKEEQELLAQAKKEAKSIKSQKLALAESELNEFELQMVSLFEEVELGDAAAEPVHSDEKPKEHTPEIDNEDVYSSEDHQQAEEVAEVVIESFIKNLTLIQEALGDNFIEEILQENIKDLQRKVGRNQYVTAEKAIKRAGRIAKSNLTPQEQEALIKSQNKNLRIAKGAIKKDRDADVGTLGKMGREANRIIPDAVKGAGKFIGNVFNATKKVVSGVKNKMDKKLQKDKEILGVNENTYNISIEDVETVLNEMGINFNRSFSKIVYEQVLMLEQDLELINVNEEEAHISGQDVSKEEAEAVKPIEVLDNTGAIAKVAADDHTEIVDGVIKIKDHDHASEEGAKVRDALHESDHKDEDEPKNAEEIAKGTDLVHSEIVDGEIKVEDHDHADAEGVEVRKEVIQEKRKLPKELEDNMYDDPTDDNTIPEKFVKKGSKLNESYTREDLQELFEALELDTKKYTFKFLAEQLGFEPLIEELEEIIVESKKIRLGNIKIKGGK
jgi:hypothetical protein